MCTHFTLLSFLEHYDYIPLLLLQSSLTIYICSRVRQGVLVGLGGIGDKKIVYFHLRASWQIFMYVGTSRTSRYMMQYNFNQKCTKYAMIPTFFGEKQVYISMYIVQTHEKSLRYIEKGVTGREKVILESNCQYRKLLERSNCCSILPIK